MHDEAGRREEITSPSDSSHAGLFGPNLVGNAGEELAERQEPNLHIASGFSTEAAGGRSVYRILDYEAYGDLPPEISTN